ncbi:MAG TPA: hypothetical protein VIY48_04445 [Candidatus Paceibacterota bacterium]
MADVNERFKQMQASFRRIPQDLAQMVSPGFSQQLAEYLRNPPPTPDKKNLWATNVHMLLKKKEDE